MSEKKPLRVMVDGRRMDARIQSDNAIAIDMPPRSTPGSAEITVESPIRGISQTFSYTYEDSPPEPSFATVSHWQFPSYEPTTVTVKGSGFNELLIGQNEAKITSTYNIMSLVKVISDSEIQFNAPYYASYPTKDAPYWAGESALWTLYGADGRKYFSVPYSSYGKNGGPNLSSASPATLSSSTSSLVLTGTTLSLGSNTSVVFVPHVIGGAPKVYWFRSSSALDSGASMTSTTVTLKGAALAGAYEKAVTAIPDEQDSVEADVLLHSTSSTMGYTGKATRITITK